MGINLPGFLQNFLLLTECRCPLCLEPFSAAGKSGLDFCPDCLKELTEGRNPCCERCGRLLNVPSTYCGECLQSPPPWLSLRRIGPYSKVLREAVVRGKFRGDIALLTALGMLLGKLIQAKPFPRAPEIIVPVPLHATRLRERGFNQSMEIAKGVAKILGLHTSPALLQRVRDTPSQRNFNKAGRITNLLGAFCSHSPVQGKHILLTDDVVTTGSTLKTATETLLTAGAASVSVAVLAKD